MSDGVTTVKAGDVLEITIDRPKANAIDLAASRRLNAVVTEFRDDPSLQDRHHHRRRRALLLPGLGSEGRRRRRRNPTRTGAWAASAASTIRAISTSRSSRRSTASPAAAGSRVVLGTDIIVMEEHAKFALPEINVGVLADAGTIKLRRRIPYHVAVEFLLTGRWMDAAEAKHWGLANHVVPKGEGLKKAREIARQLADGPPLLFPAIKQLLRHTEMVPEHEAFELHDSLDMVQRVVRSEDLLEGTRAFAEKRKPRWTGR